MFDLLFVQCLCMPISLPFCYIGGVAVNVLKDFKLFSDTVMPVLA